jgi:hypothetical protein
VDADYRVRPQIKDSLEQNYLRNQNQSFAAHIAFQIGFGVKSNDNKCHMWLGKSNKQLDDPKLIKEAVQPTNWRSARMCNRDLNGDVTVDLIHEYKTWGLNKLGEARIVYEREVGDMARHFGELHFIPLALYKIMGDLLDQLGEFGKSETLRVRIRDRIENTGGVGHPFYFQSTEQVATSHRRLGEWMEAQLLEEEVLKRTKSTCAQIFQEEVLKHKKSTYGV